MSAPAAELRYQSAPRWHARRVFRRVILPILLVLAAGFAWWFGPAAWGYVQSLYWQRQCMAYAAAPGRVAYDDDPVNLPSLLATGAYETDVRSLGPTHAILRNVAWRQYAGKALPQVFMHRRRSPGGDERLVVLQIVNLRGRSADPYDRLIFMPYVESPKSTLLPPKALHSQSASLQMFRTPGDATRVLEGQADANDPSHFTIDYVHNGTAGTIDGWLNDNGTVTLSPRAGTYVQVTPGFVQWSPAGALPAGLSAVPVRDAATQPVRPPNAAD